MPLLRFSALILLLLVYAVVSKSLMHIRLASLSRFIIGRVGGIVRLSRSKLPIDVWLIGVFLGCRSCRQDLDLEFFRLVARVLRLMLWKLLVEDGVEWRGKYYC